MTIIEQLNEWFKSDNQILFEQLKKEFEDNKSKAKEKLIKRIEKNLQKLMLYGNLTCDDHGKEVIKNCLDECIRKEPLFYDPIHEIYEGEGGNISINSTYVECGEVKGINITLEI